MAQFDVYAFPGSGVPLVVDVQADFLRDLLSRVVVPLMPVSVAGDEQLPRLKPMVTIGDADYVFMTTDIAAVPVRRLGPHVANIRGEYREELTNALDFLIYGF